MTVPQLSGGNARIRALRLDLGDGALLVGLAATGTVPLPDLVPTLWIMAPTAEDDALGFAINGTFDVDAGRTRLADSEDANLETADRLGQRLCQALDALVEGISENWGEVSQSLSLNEEVTPYDLWRTLVGGL